MLALLLFFLFWFSIYFQNAYLRTSISNITIFIGIWFLVSILYYFDLSSFDELSLEVTLYIIMMMCLYLISYLLFFHVLKIRKAIKIADANLNTKMISLLKWFFLFMWLIFFSYFISSIGWIEGLTNLFLGNNARETLRNDENSNISYYIFGYLYLLSIFYESEANGQNVKPKDKFLLIVVLISLLLTAAKMNFITACILIYFCWVMKTARSLYKIGIDMFKSTAVMYIFIIIFSIFTGKVIDHSAGHIREFSDIYNLTKGTLLYPYDYLVGSLAAFDVFFNNINDYINNNDYEGYILKRFYQFMNIVFGTSFNLPPHNLKFTSVGNISTNVYTFNFHIISDIGIYFSCFVYIFLAFVHSYVDKSNALQLYNGFWFYALKMTLLSCNFFSVISFKYNDTFFMLILIILLLSYFLKLILSKNNSIIGSGSFDR